jgi:glycerol-3-phosphate acyltransferase PlsY
MNVLSLMFALILGYFSGAISFTRILGRLFAPGEDLSVTEFQATEESPVFRMKSVSATSLAFRKGPKAGCLVSILDMLKAALPTLTIRLLYPGTDLYWLTAAAAVVGHNFPVYYKFKGGRGISPLYGGLFVLDWLAIPGTTLAGMVLGLLVGDMFIIWIGSIPMLLLWVILRQGTLIPILYAVIVNIFFWAAILPELRDHLENRRQGNVEKIDIARFFGGASEMFSGKMPDGPAADTSAKAEETPQKESG